MMIKSAIKMLARESEQAKLVILAYHKILPMCLGSITKGTTQNDLEQQLLWLARNFDVLPLREAVERCQAGKLKQPTACVTFDDGYATQYSIASKMLLKLGMPATFFVTTGHNENRLLWNDVLHLFLAQSNDEEHEEFARLVGVPESQRLLDSPMLKKGALEQRTKYLSVEDRGVALGFARSTLGPLALDRIMMDNEEIRSLSSHGFDIGGHTVDHPILSMEKPKEAERQIVEGLETLSHITGKPITSFAFPNGKPDTDYNADHLRMISRSGVSVALTSALGHFSPGRDPLQIARVVFEGGSSLGFLRTLRGAYTAEYHIADSRGYHATSR